MRYPVGPAQIAAVEGFVGALVELRVRCSAGECVAAPRGGYCCRGQDDGAFGGSRNAV
jgi:hypothetical protein